MTIQLGNGICSWDPLELLHRARASEANTAWALLNDALAKAGFGHAFYTFGVPTSSTQPLRDKFERGILGGGRFAGAFFPEFMKRPRLLAQDPVAAHCKRSMTPFVWSTASLARRERTGLALAYDFDISAFIAFPLRNAEGTHYGNLTVYCEVASHKSWLDHAMRLAPMLHLSAQYFHDRLAGISAVSAVENEIGLSPRQRECLIWVARGLSTKQVADRLMLSEPVVNEYLQSAKRKLGCSTRTHAVARALLLNLIQP